MYLQIRTAKLVPDTYGKHIKITKVWLYDSDGKRTSRVKLNDVVLGMLLKAKLDVIDKPTETTSF